MLVSAEAVGEKLRRVVIEPVSRVEGHGKVTLLLDEAGHVREARLHIVEFRGFEKFIQGRPYWEVPVMVQRLCGICPVSHHLAASKAMDRIVGVRHMTDSAVKLRRLVENQSLRLVVDLAQVIYLDSAATSQKPADARHSVAAGTRTSEGHAACEPVHVSATSQASVAARQTLPLGRLASGPRNASTTCHVAFGSATSTTKVGRLSFIDPSP